MLQHLLPFNGYGDGNSNSKTCQTVLAPKKKKLSGTVMAINAVNAICITIQNNQTHPHNIFSSSCGKEECYAYSIIFLSNFVALPLHEISESFFKFSFHTFFNCQRTFSLCSLQGIVTKPKTANRRKHQEKREAKMNRLVYNKFC